MTIKPIACGVIAALCMLTGAHAQKAPTPAASQPQSEASLPSQHKGSTPRPSVENRAAVKADAKAARQSGTLLQGEQSTPRQAKGARPAASEKSRAEVKSDAAAANKAGTQPKGEESVKGQSTGKN